MNNVLGVVWGQPVTIYHAVFAVGVLIFGFGLGLLAGRGGRRAGRSADQLKRSPSQDAFMRGISHLMADHTDQAIQEFTRAVQLNSETVETYVVLGNLFRQKGEIERALHIRQTIIARPNLDPKVRMRALYDLGLDYKKGGLFNRAAEAFEKVTESDPKHEEAWRQIAKIYEELRDWPNAFEALRRLDKLTSQDSRDVLAHYKAEEGKELMASGRLDQAEDALNTALGVDKGCLDAYLHLGDLEMARSRTRKALNLWRKAVRLSPRFAHLVVKRVIEADTQLEDKQVGDLFAEINLEQTDAHGLLLLASYHYSRGNSAQALELLGRAVRQSPRHLGPHRLLGEILISEGRKEEALEAYGNLLRHLGADQEQYLCAHCGFTSHQLSWKCPRCHHWDSMSPTSL